MSAQGLYTGIAVVIDDQLQDENSEIAKIVAAIKNEGGHIVGHTQLPNADDSLINFEGASFFILDWHLDSSTLASGEFGETVAIPEHLQREQIQAKIEFLLALKQHRLAPVFIFTAAGVDSVREALRHNHELFPTGEQSHILVMSKQDVLDKGVFKVLNDWTQDNPAALALKSWEQEYQRAKNRLFLDFYNKSSLWPAILWKTFQDDGLPPSDELGRLLSQNLISRMVPFSIDMSHFMDSLSATIEKDRAKYRDTLLDVLGGERFVRKDGLHDNSVAPGDVFKVGPDYFLNIRPECDCVVRGGENQLTLYLLKGKKLSQGAAAKKIERPSAGQFTERDDEALVFAMYERSAFCFKLKELHQKPWEGLKDDRIGRLLPPFLTRIQQRYSAYLMRPGLPKIPTEAMPQAVLDKLKEEELKQTVEAVAPEDIC